MQFNTISMIGLGYIGLPTAAVFASHGFNVIGVDVNPEVVETINRGHIHIVEPGLEAAVKGAVDAGRLCATLRPQRADAFLIAVPTPFKNDSHDPDLSYIQAAARAIAPILERGNLVVLESTSPVGATEQLSAWLAEYRPDLGFPHETGEEADVQVAHCPERVLPGHVLRELVENDRVIGGITPRCSAAACELYKRILQGQCVVTNARTAEMAKLTENSFRDVNIAFANELSMICEKLQINVWELIALANRHPRVNILQPGPGVGGHCIAVDPWFIVSQAPQQARLIRTAREVNDGKPQWVVNQVDRAVGEFLRNNPDKTAKDITLACFGLAFKPDIDDLRESPALAIATRLLREHPGQVLMVEPNIQVLPERCMDASLVSAETALAVADIAVLLVDHAPFRQLGLPAGLVYVDTRGIWL